MTMCKENCNGLQPFFFNNHFNLGTDIRHAWINDDALRTFFGGQDPTIGCIHRGGMDSNQHLSPSAFIISRSIFEAVVRQGTFDLPSSPALTKASLPTR
jgi:hypothetical protein